MGCGTERAHRSVYDHNVKYTAAQIWLLSLALSNVLLKAQAMLHLQELELPFNYC